MALVTSPRQEITLVTRMHSNRMCTTRSLPSRGSLSWGLCQGDPLDRDPLMEHGTRDRDPQKEKEHRNRDRNPPGRTMGPGSQTGSDIIQRPPPPLDRMTDASKNITLPQISFADGKYVFLYWRFCLYLTRNEKPSWTHQTSPCCLQYWTYRSS